jgi:3-oxoacyl-[acyl-carrier protein] reductase
MFDLTGKRALVTGASRGIGRGIALALAKQGADVAVNYRSNQAEAETVAAEIKVLGREALALQADVSQKTSVMAMFAQIKSQWNKLDILVNNAGIALMGPFEAITEEDWDKVLDTNLKSQFLCVQEAIKLMKPGGKIINLSSIASGGVGVGFGTIAHYAASKGGVVGLTEDLAIDLAVKGINVNAIAPGVIETDMTKSLTSDPQAAQGLLARIPKKRFGKPEDIGAAAVYLASDEADYVTGTILYIDGGWLTG